MPCCLPCRQEVKEKELHGGGGVQDYSQISPNTKNPNLRKSRQEVKEKELIAGELAAAEARLAATHRGPLLLKRWVSRHDAACLLRKRCAAAAVAALAAAAPALRPI